MKIQLTMMEMGELHLLLEPFSKNPNFTEFRSSIESAGGKLRGALERFGARMDGRGWRFLKSKADTPVEVKLEKLEAIILRRLAKIAVVKIGGELAPKSLLPAHEKLSAQLDKAGVALKP